MNSMNNTCICIPARYNSSRLPGKLLFLLGNKTCIQRTIEQVLPVGLPIFVFCDHILIFEHIISTFRHCSNDVIAIKAYAKCKNGTERISRYLHDIPQKYDVIVNIQADEPFINTENVKHAILKYQETIQITSGSANMFYTTLHEPFIPNTQQKKNYLTGTSSLTVTTSLSGRVLSYTRNIMPWNKKGIIEQNHIYKLFTGIYVFNRQKLDGFYKLPDTPLQLLEDIEQLKILEHDYSIYSYSTVEPNEISLNDTSDLNILCVKYKLKCIPHIVDNNKIIQKQ